MESQTGLRDWLVHTHTRYWVDNAFTHTQNTASTTTRGSRQDNEIERSNAMRVLAGSIMICTSNSGSVFLQARRKARHTDKSQAHRRLGNSSNS